MRTVRTAVLSSTIAFFIIRAAASELENRGGSGGRCFGLFEKNNGDAGSPAEASSCSAGSSRFARSMRCDWRSVAFARFDKWGAASGCSEGDSLLGYDRLRRSCFEGDLDLPLADGCDAVRRRSNNWSRDTVNDSGRSGAPHVVDPSSFPVWPAVDDDCIIWV